MSEERETLVTEKQEEPKEVTTEETFYPESQESESDSEESSEEKESEQTSEEKSEDSEDDKKQDDKEAAEEEKEVSYKLELREESLLDNSVVETVTVFAKENNLSNEQAQQLLDQQDQLIQNFQDSQRETYEDMLEDWRNTVINDKELGGDNLNATATKAQRVTSTYASEELIDLLRQTGYGDHPEVVKFLAKIGEAMGDDSVETGKFAKKEQTFEEAFYGNKY
jgi:hypothetical protein